MMMTLLRTPVGGDQPRDPVETQLDQVPVDDAQVHVEQIEPDDRNDGAGHQDREEEDGPEEDLEEPWDEAVEGHGQDQGPHQIQRNHAHHVVDGVAEDLQDALILNHLDEILAPHERGRRQQVVAHEAQRQAPDDWAYDEGEETHHGGQDEQPGGQCVAPPQRPASDTVAASSKYLSRCTHRAAALQLGEGSAGARTQADSEHRPPAIRNR